MTGKRFTVGLRQNTTQYEIIDNWKTGHYPFLEPFYYKKTAKDLAKFLNELNDENTHIKNTITEMYNNERTMMGKSVLKQLMEQIK